MTVPDLAALGFVPLDHKAHFSPPARDGVTPAGCIDLYRHRGTHDYLSLISYEGKLVEVVLLRYAELQDIRPKKAKAPLEARILRTVEDWSVLDTTRGTK